VDSIGLPGVFVCAHTRFDRSLATNDPVLLRCGGQREVAVRVNVIIVLDIYVGRAHCKLH
jgi:hypothetical protein